MNAFVATHAITRTLRDLGVTEQQLASVRFWKHGPDVPFEYWPITFSGRVDHAPLSTLRAYGALKLLSDPNCLETAHREAAARLVSETEAQLQYDFVRAVMQQMGRCPEEAMRDHEYAHRYRLEQRRRAQKPRPITDDGRNLAELVQELMVKPENREAKAADLWPKLYALLEELDLEPEDLGNKYSYRAGGVQPRTIAFRSFTNRVSKIRRHLAH